MQVVNLLNLDYPSDVGPPLVEEVLATLMSLMAGNQSSRCRISTDVGYDTLLHIILRQTAPGGPSRSLLTRLLNLVLEVRLLNLIPRH